MSQSALDVCQKSMVPQPVIVFDLARRSETAALWAQKTHSARQVVNHEERLVATDVLPKMLVGPWNGGGGQPGVCRCRRLEWYREVKKRRRSLTRHGIL